MKRRVLSLGLALALALSLLTTAFAAGTTLTVKTPSTIPKAGEEFTVTVEISGNPGLAALQFTLAFDRDIMECVSAELKKPYSVAISATNPVADTGAIVAAASAEAMSGEGIIAEYHFLAKKDVREFNFSLEEIVLTDTNRQAISYSVQNAKFTSSSTPTTSASSTTPATSTAQTTPVEGAAGGTAAVFPDAVGHWGEAWIVKAAERGLFSGDDKGNFLPNKDISRGDYVLVLWRMAGKPEPSGASPFSDVTEKDYYAKAVAWAYEKGYVNGKGSGFAPKDSLTRQEAMKILFGYAGSPSGMELMFAAEYDKAFTDSAAIASWAKPAMYWAYYNGIINGMSANVLGPEETATRAQLAKILVGYMDKQS